MNMSLNWPITDDGFMSALMDMFGFQMCIMLHGGLIIMEDGPGIPLSDGPGFPMSLGDGVYIIMGDGTGGWALDGTGFQQDLGDLHGYIGTGGIIILGGAL